MAQVHARGAARVRTMFPSKLLLERCSLAGRARPVASLADRWDSTPAAAAQVTNAPQGVWVVAHLYKDR